MNNILENINSTYNTCCEKLLMPEYGRNVQQMVKFALSLSDKDERQHCAEYIIQVMAKLQSDQSGQSDFYHKLWNHLARISNYQLDIDYPVEIVAEEVINRHPDPMEYPMQKIRHRHYGHLLEQSLQQALELSDDEQRGDYVLRLANQMKQSLGWWNPDSMDDELVASDINRYTNGSLSLNLDECHLASVASQAQSLDNIRKSERQRNRKKKI